MAWCTKGMSVDSERQGQELERVTWQKEWPMAWTVQREWTAGLCVACSDLRRQGAWWASAFAYLWIHDDFHVNSILFLQSFNCSKRDPEIVCVKYFEFWYRLELIDMCFWHLSDFHQSQFAFILSECPTLERQRRASECFHIFPRHSQTTVIAYECYIEKTWITKFPRNKKHWQWCNQWYKATYVWKQNARK